MKHILENLKTAFDDFYDYGYSGNDVIYYAIQCLDEVDSYVMCNFPDSIVKREYLSGLRKVLSGIVLLSKEMIAKSTASLLTLTMA